MLSDINVKTLDLPRYARNRPDSGDFPQANDRIYWLPNSTKVNADEVLSCLHHEDQLWLDGIKAPERRQEFIRSRWLMWKLGVLHDARPSKGPAGAPTFRDGINGSITHKGGTVAICCNVRSEEPSLLATGIDVEATTKLNPALRTKICTPLELEYLSNLCRQNSPDEQRYLALIFSFKESLFKAHFTLGQRMFYFHDAEISDIRPNTTEHGFIAARLLLDSSPITKAGEIFFGSYVFADENGCPTPAGPLVMTMTHVYRHKH